MSLIRKKLLGVRYTGWAALGRDPQEDTSGIQLSILR